jgi:LacI family transcriptional regulator
MRGSSYTIGVMTAELSTPFQPEVVDAINRELVKSPFQMIVVLGGESIQGQQLAIESLVDRRVDGLILILPSLSQAGLEGLGKDYATVAIARHGGGANFDSVVDDDREGSLMVVDHLVELGHTRIVHTSHPQGPLAKPFVLSHTARYEGYVEAMARHGLEPDVIETAYSERGGYEAALQALSRRSRPTAIFAGCDVAAFGVLRAAEESGVRVPEELSVVGFDNVYATSIGRVSLTTVDQSGLTTGSIAARLLLERIGGRTKPVHHVIAPRLIERTTTAAPARARTRRRAATKLAS